jgi:hypothetical protein
MDWNGTERSFFMNAILGRTALALAIVMATLPANARAASKVRLSAVPPDTSQATTG